MTRIKQDCVGWSIITNTRPDKPQYETDGTKTSRLFELRAGQEVRRISDALSVGILSTGFYEVGFNVLEVRDCYVEES